MPKQISQQIKNVSLLAWVYCLAVFFMSVFIRPKQPIHKLLERWLSLAYKCLRDTLYWTDLRTGKSPEFFVLFISCFSLIHEPDSQICHSSRNIFHSSDCFPGGCYTFKSHNASCTMSSVWKTHSSFYSLFWFYWLLVDSTVESKSSQQPQYEMVGSYFPPK